MLSIRALAPLPERREDIKKKTKGFQRRKTRINEVLRCTVFWCIGVLLMYERVYPYCTVLYVRSSTGNWANDVSRLWAGAWTSMPPVLNVDERTYVRRIFSSDVLYGVIICRRCSVIPLPVPYRY